jgi:transcription initiation factor TFIIB
MIIFDPERGEYVDTETGEVIEDRVIDLGPEWRVYDNGDRTERERVGSPLTLRVHDQGLTTTIGGYGKVKDRTKLMKMQRLQRSIRVTNRNRKLVTLLTALNAEASKMSLPEHVRETAALLLRKVVEKKLERRVDPLVLVVAVLYYSCQVNNIPLYLQEFKQKFNISASEIWKVMRRINEAVPDFRHTVSKPTKYIPKIVDKLRLPPIINARASELIDCMYRNGLTGGRSYLSLSAAAVYIVSVLLDNRRTQKEIGEVLGISDVTIRNSYKQIVEKLGPITYKCKACDFVLYKFEEVGQDYHGVRTPSEVKSMYAGKCPRCGHELGEPVMTKRLEVIL